MTYPLLIASNNPGKLREFGELLADLPLRVVTPAALGLRIEVPETGASYAANARAKARAFAERSGLITLADDSGLEIVALQGWPGVQSARVAGPTASDAERRALVLERLAGRPASERRARFVCHIVIAGPAAIVAEARGSLVGQIALESSGSGGFGYDAIFVPQGYDQTLATLPPETKNRISHRARALRRLRPFLARLASL